MVSMKKLIPTFHPIQGSMITVPLFLSPPPPVCLFFCLIRIWR